jgi:hypothetical protein
MGERRKEFVGPQLEDGACGEAFLFVDLQLERKKKIVSRKKKKLKSKK